MNLQPYGRHPTDLPPGQLLCRTCGEVKGRQAFPADNRKKRGYGYTCIRCKRRKRPISRTVAEWRAAGIV